MARSTSKPSLALLASSDIAKLADVSAAAVSNWRKRAADFPEPAGGTELRPLFARDEVIAWMNANNKQIVEQATTNTSAILNMLRDALPIERSAELLLSLFVARKLCDEAAAPQPWVEFQRRAEVDGFDALRELGNSLTLERWDALVVLSDDVDRVRPEVVALIAQAIGRIPIVELADAADAVLARAVGALGRRGSDLGYIGNPVSRFLAAISLDDTRGTVYDPACGIADVLTQLAATRGEVIDRLVGHDINREAVTIARQRAYLHDADLELRITDVLADDIDPDLTADLIVADPPYGMKFDDYNLLDPRWVYGISKASTELAWIQHAIAHLADDGVAYVATPGGALFHGREKEIRRKLIADGCVQAIYQLPPRLLQHTSIAVAVWVLGKPGTSQTIRFVNADTADVTGGRAGFESSQKSADVSIDDVLAGDANLVPERWIGLDTPDPADVADAYTEALTRITSSSRSAATLSVQKFDATGPVRIATLGELAGQEILQIQLSRPGPRRADEKNDSRHVSGRDIATGQISTVDESTEPDDDKLTAANDVLIATIGQLSAVLDESGGHTLGPGVAALRILDDQLRPDYLAAVLSGRWNKRFFTGQAIQRLNVRELEIPILTPSDQAAFAKAAADLKELQREAAQLHDATSEALDRLSEVARYGLDDQSTRR